MMFVDKMGVSLGELNLIIMEYWLVECACRNVANIVSLNLVGLHMLHV